MDRWFLYVQKPVRLFFRIPEPVGTVSAWGRFVRRKLSAKARWYVPVYQQGGLQALSRDTPGINRGLALNKRLRSSTRPGSIPDEQPSEMLMDVARKLAKK